MTRAGKGWIAAGLGVLLLLSLIVSQLAAVGAGGLLHPLRRLAIGAPPPGCDEVTFHGAGVNLQGWQFRGTGARRGTLIYLHGIADNRASGAGIIARFSQRGFDVVAYDGRAHGKSDGAACTYGFLEKDDLARVIDQLPVRPIVLLGNSLGAAIALQEAATDNRVAAVIAAETFSDLQTVARERAPRFFTPALIARAFRLAEEQGHFRVAEVSPVIAAQNIRVPVLLIHGAADRDTPPAHSQRVFAALAGPKRLLLVPGARHNESLRGAEVWGEIERWLDAALANAPAQN